MIRSSRPATNPHIKSALGSTKDGYPLSYNRAPASDLAAWIARLTVTKVHVQPGHPITCGRFADTAGVGIQLVSDFEGDAINGSLRHNAGALFFGPQSRLLPVRLNGEFVSISVLFRPSACSALVGRSMSQFVDRVFPTQQWRPQDLVSMFDPDGSPEEWLQIVENLVRKLIVERGAPAPDPVTAKFEEIAFCDPGISISDAARRIDVDRRRLERLVVRDFGMPPKQVLKRARALDMASHLCGVADGDEAETLALRYYDESHLIREFIELFGISPRRFTLAAQPLLTLNLEIRQARRLEMTKRLAPGARRPWE